MAVTLTLDAVSGATFQTTSTGTRIVRTGWIKGLKTLAVPSNKIFTNAITAAVLPAYLSAYPDPDYSSCLLRQHLINTYEGNNNKLRVTLIYDSNNGLAVPPVTFILSRRTTLVETETELHPDLLETMEVQYQDPDKAQYTERRTARFRYRRPHQILIADGYYVGEPPPEMIGALGSVNDATWRGLPRGYWLYSDQSDVTRDYGGSYNITLQLETKLREDWSQYEVLRNPNGRFLKPDQEDVDELKNAQYEYNWFMRNGITKAGLYPVAPFDDIFGFGGIGG